MAHQVAFTVEPMDRGSAAVCGDVRIEATLATYPKGNISALVTMRRGAQLVATQTVMLSNEKRRAAFLSADVLTKAGVEPSVLSQMLLELTDVLQRDRQQKHQRTAPAIVPRTSLSEVVPATLRDLTTLIGERLLLGDDDVLDVVLGARQSHRLAGVRCWLMIVGPPSGSKTEIIMSTKDIPGTYALSELTSKTFASGMKVDPGQENPSLLARLTTEVLVFKDFTTILEMHREERQAILAQLREIHDGSFDKVWGTGKEHELHWSGSLGFLAGVTEAIDRHHGVMALLGPRFLMFRPGHADRRAVARRAIDNNARDGDELVKQRHARAVAAYMATLPTIAPGVPAGVRDTVTRLADLVTRARSAVTRDGNRAVEYAPAAEMPARFAAQTFALLQGVTLVRQHAEPTRDDVRVVIRVALDSIPALRRRALAALLCGDEDLATTSLASDVRAPTTTMRRAMEDLQAQGLVTCRKGGKADLWSFAGDWRGVAEEFMTVPETSEGAHMDQKMCSSDAHPPRCSPTAAPAGEAFDL